MNDSKGRVSASITRARTALDQALIELAELPAFDPGATALLSHALNNYLTVSLASIDVLRNILMQHPDPEVQNLLASLSHATELMAHGVSRLQGETAQARFDSNEIDLHTIIQRAIRYYKRKADAKNITLVVGTTGDDFQFWSDGVTVAAILDNLISNAIKYSPPGAMIWVQTIGDADGVMCEVRDQGPGLSTDDQGRLFQHGVQLTPKPTAGESSHGYGLAVARVLVSRLAGSIGCRSELGMGSCFWFRFPRRRPDTEAGPKDA